MFGFFTYPKRLNDLFADAVNVWMVIGDEDALEIACNAAKTAAQEQRDTMLLYAFTADEPLKQLSEHFDGLPEALPTGEKLAGPELMRERLNVLLEKIATLDNVSLLQARKAMNPANEKAVRKADTFFFRSRYPSFPLWDS